MIPAAGNAGPVAFAPVAFGRNGIVGVLTPAGNPTVEPELARLFGDEALMLTARMCSPAASMDQRLLDYVQDIETPLGSFGGVPIDVFAFACTGSSYLVGLQAEQEWTARLAARKIRLLTAGAAIRQACSVLGGSRVVLVNPYPADLLQAALAYWREAGLQIVDVVDVAATAGGYHPVYNLTDDAVTGALATALERTAGNDADLVLMSGTGMPTLPAMAAVAGRSERPVLSSNLCLAWASLVALGLDLPLAGWAADAARKGRGGSVAGGQHRR
jgi:maleate isomerase